jgi:glyoxylase-like metal-dependent hydrolase (beta-lactamase superfamily II)
MAYLTEAQPPRGAATPAAPGIRRIVADNPGPMTYHGTNTYLIEGPDGTIVLDPGPLDAAHTKAVLAAAGRVTAIWVTHTHTDHVGGLPALREATGAPVFAFSAAVSPDHVLAEGAVLSGWTALHTPGHAPDHLCFARQDGTLFSGDHVMGWSSTVVSPPEGSMSAYFTSLRRLLARSDSLYLPGHGPAIAAPRAYGIFLLAHRQGREDAILAALARQPQDTGTLVANLYANIAPHLHAAAERNVLAHLEKLAEEGRAVRTDQGWTIPSPNRG